MIDKVADKARISPNSQEDTIDSGSNALRSAELPKRPQVTQNIERTVEHTATMMSSSPMSGRITFRVPQSPVAPFPNRELPE